jgi:hypothetical protein
MASAAKALDSDLGEEKRWEIREYAAQPMVIYGH